MNFNRFEKANPFIQMIYPNKCGSCGEIIEENKFFCKNCEETVQVVDQNKTCKICGNETQDCRCSSSIFRFQRNISVFKYNNAARNAILSYKLKRHTEYRFFFGSKIAEICKKEYADVKFDAVTYVPTSLKHRIRNGFDHSYLLAKAVADELGLPLIKTLKCKIIKKDQHGHSYRERKANIIGKYKSCANVSGNVLLIDDIFTTGSTVDECTKVLLFSGALKVYSATALITIPKRDVET